MQTHPAGDQHLHIQHFSKKKIFKWRRQGENATSVAATDDEGISSFQRHLWTFDGVSA